MITDPRAVRERDERIYARLVAAYAQGEAELQRAAAAALASGKIGSAAYRKGQSRQIQQILSDLQDVAIPMAEAIVAEAFVTGARELGERVPPGFVGGVNRDAVVILIENAAGRLNEMATIVGRRVDDVFRQVALREVTQGVIRGDARRDVSSRIAKRLAGDAPVSAVRVADRAGRSWQLSKYAEMVARTTTREAMTAGTVARLTELGYDLVTVSSHIHSPDVCSDFDGKTFSLSGESSEHPLLVRRPPYHPNCVHVLTPGPRS